MLLAAAAVRLVVLFVADAFDVEQAQVRFVDGAPVARRRSSTAIRKRSSAAPPICRSGGKRWRMTSPTARSRRSHPTRRACSRWSRAIRSVTRSARSSRLRSDRRRAIHARRGRQLSKLQGADVHRNPRTTNGAQLSLYEASPSIPRRISAASMRPRGSGFKKLGSAQLGAVATVSLGKQRQRTRRVRRAPARRRLPTAPSRRCK